MGNINTVTITGNLTADCEKRKAGETPLVQFAVAVNEFRKDKDDYVSFIDCTLYGKRAVVLSDYLLKGQRVSVQGKLHQDRWETEDGSKRAKLYVVVNEIDFIIPKKQDNATDDIPW